jgi:hypothetical protein
VELAVIVGLATRSALVHLGSDRVSDVGQLLLLLLEVLSGSLGTVDIEPLGSLLDGIQDLVL